MRIIFLPEFWTIALDILAWAILQPLTAAVSALIPLEKLDAGNPVFRTARWEMDGEVYQRLFNIRAWKKRLPSGGAWFGKMGFRIDVIHSRDEAYLDRWIRETCRAEICHWLSIFPAVLFFLWNLPSVGWIMIVYACIFNFPLIIAQRYNRPKMKRMLERIRELNCRKTEYLTR